MTEINESVYLNAARARVRATFTFVGLPVPKDLDRTAAVAARDPVFRAAVESVWEARGRHDAEAIRRVHEHIVETNPVGTKFIDCAVCGFVGYVGKPGDDEWCPTVAALDVVRPAEDGPEELDEEDHAPWSYTEFGVLCICGRTHRRLAPGRVVGTLDAPGAGTPGAPALAAPDGGQLTTGMVDKITKSDLALAAALTNPPAAIPVEFDDAPAEPATDRGTGRPCTIYVPPEYCSDPHRCRVHRGAYPEPTNG